MLRNHILKPDANATPGVTSTLLLAPEPWFDEIAVPPATETTPGSDIIITDTHTFSDPNYGFIKLELTAKTAFLTMTQTGEIDSESTNTVYEGFSSGLNPALLSFMGKTFKGIVLAQDKNCDVTRYYQVGQACSLAYKKGFEFTTGVEGGEGRKGMKVRFEATQDKPLIYTGGITYAVQPTIS